MIGRMKLQVMLRDCMKAGYEDTTYMDSQRHCAVEDLSIVLRCWTWEGESFK